MKKLLLVLTGLFCLGKAGISQQCPGGGTTFATAVVFNQAWVSGCLTGTSCNGGIEFDNRAACEPTTAMDGCGPAPTCTSATNGSDIWFSFYATSPSVTINVIQSISFIASIQAFSGSACGGLTQIGCALAGGPSSGVSLTLSGLSTGQQYYYRIFGSSNSASQRTGVYCFCGSVGLGSSVLPVQLSSFKAINNQNRISLSWSTATETNNQKFEIERSNDAVNFTSLASVNGKGNSNSPSQYSYADYSARRGINYYRLKIISFDGTFYYSEIVSVMVDKQNSLVLLSNPVRDRIILQSEENGTVNIINSAGQYVKQVRLQKGRNEISSSNMPEGIYFIRSNNGMIRLNLLH